MDILPERLKYLKSNYNINNSSSDRTTGYEYLIDNCDIMVLDSKEHPGKLKDNVCSPGRCTISRVRALEKGGFRGTIMDAVEAGKVRMEEVGKKAD